MRKFRISALLLRTVRAAIVLLGLAAFSVSCAGPEARFITDRKEYTGGDTVHLKSSSLAADSLEWSLNEQVIGHGPELKVVLDKMAQGPQVFRLRAFNGGESSVATQSVLATTALGTITAWATFAGMEIINVTSTGEKVVGVSGTGFQNDPGCAAEGAVSIRLVPGTYTVDGASLITRSRRIVTLQAGECLSVKMH